MGMNDAVRVKVPAKLMLFGEYSVLWGQECLAFSLDRFMTIDASRTEAKSVVIESDLWSELLELERGRPIPAFAEGHLIVPLIVRLQKQFSLTGLRLKISSGWDISDGLGSSSALSLGVCLAAASLSRPEIRDLKADFPGVLWDCARIAWENQVQQQGFASGYDIACQLMGGLMGFSFTKEQWPATVTAYKHRKLSDYVQVFSGGRGAPTKGVGSKTIAWIEQNQLKLKFIDLMNAAKDSFLKVLSNEASNLEQIAIAKIAELRSILLPSPFFPLQLEDALKTCRGFDRDFTYKTTGAGGEDAIILFGTPKHTEEARHKLASLGWHQLDINFPCHGASIE